MVKRLNWNAINEIKISTKYGNWGFLFYGNERKNENNCLPMVYRIKRMFNFNYTREFLQKPDDIREKLVYRCYENLDRHIAIWIQNNTSQVP